MHTIDPHISMHKCVQTAHAYPRAYTYVCTHIYNNRADSTAHCACHTAADCGTDRCKHAAQCKALQPNTMLLRNTVLGARTLRCNQTQHTAGIPTEPTAPPIPTCRHICMVSQSVSFTQPIPTCGHICIVSQSVSYTQLIPTCRHICMDSCLNTCLITAVSLNTCLNIYRYLRACPNTYQAQPKPRCHHMLRCVDCVHRCMHCCAYIRS